MSPNVLVATPFCSNPDSAGAAGGDILFGEACLARVVSLQLPLPLPLPPRIIPDELGPLPRECNGNPTDPFERCNRWLLYSALAQGLDRLRFICLWNGGGGDGAGGTANMFRQVTRRAGRVTWLDTRKLS